jgi:hypothetical protein
MNFRPSTTDAVVQSERSLSTERTNTVLYSLLLLSQVETQKFLHREAMPDDRALSLQSNWKM